ncbi:hypothetical protein ABPG77_001472 [Micractinium sp. CCAP 211/92]
MCGASLPTMHQARASAAGRHVKSEGGARYCGGKHKASEFLRHGSCSLARCAYAMSGGSIAGIHKRCACPSAAAPGNRTAGFTVSDSLNTVASRKEGMAFRRSTACSCQPGTPPGAIVALLVSTPLTAMTPAEFRARFTTNLRKPELKASGVQRPKSPFLAAGKLLLL